MLRSGWGNFFFLPSGRDGRSPKNLKEITMTTTENNHAKSPSHIAYHVRETKDGKGFWTRIGSVWPHSDGKGFNVQFDTVPLDGRITIRIAAENKA